MHYFYNEYSDTIRQHPENYLIAYRKDNRWICEPDLAANKRKATKLFKLLFNFDYKYGSPDKILNKL